jgi:GntR family transcriptional regulator/MocR family aminotransferase
LQEIRTKVLPRRGIHTRPDELLLTSGAQQALYLTAELLVEPGTVVAVEEPGNPELIALLRRRGARLVHQPVDEEGMVIDEALAGCAVAYVSPGHQRPTGATLSAARRSELMRMAAAHDFVVVEDDFECETNYLEPSLPALRASGDGDRVVYAVTLVQSLAPALRIGMLVASAPVVRAARALRRLTTRHPPLSVQRTAAHLLALGHYDTIMIRVGQEFRKRLHSVRDALNHYLPQSIAIPPVRGGTTYWVRGAAGLEVAELAAAAEARGVLIEPAARYYARSEGPHNYFRLSVTSIREESIRPGIAALAEAMRALSASAAPGIPASCLSGVELHRIMPGATFLLQTVYGDPCTIELAANGSMSGRAGFANEDVDRGRWWIENDQWCRQWHEWAYGEVARFRVAIEGDRIRWLNTAGRQVDSALIVRPDAR